MPKIIVYGTPISAYVRTVRLLLEEAGADYDLKSVDIFNGENKSAEYLAKHPFGKVPTVEVDGEVIDPSAFTWGYRVQSGCHPNHEHKQPFVPKASFWDLQR